MSVSCHGSAISENTGGDILFKNLGARIFMKLKKLSAKNLKFSFNWITPTQIMPTRFTQIWQTLNQKSTWLGRLLSITKKMPLGSHDLCTSTIYVTSQSSTFSTRTPLAHNNVSSVHTQYLVPVTHHGKNDPPSPFMANHFQHIW